VKRLVFPVLSCFFVALVPPSRPYPWIEQRNTPRALPHCPARYAAGRAEGRGFYIGSAMSYSAWGGAIPGSTSGHSPASST